MSIISVVLAVVGRFYGVYDGSELTEEQIRILHIDGVTEAVDDGMAGVGCSDSDDFFPSRRFRGVKNGTPVSGVICRGYFKGSTVRYS